MKDNIDIWLLDQKKITPLYGNWRDLLSIDEQQRADRFHFEDDRVSFIVYHACKRLILAHYLNESPKKIIFSQREKGKPFLPNEKIYFNLSHTKNMAILAVTNNIEVGVDIEKIKSAHDYLAIAERFFHPEEYNYLKRLDKAQQSLVFFELWTAKEAILKATGEGISSGMNGFCVQIASNQLTFQHADLRNISLLRLEAPAGYVASTAALAKSISISYRNFSQLADILHAFS